MTDDFTTASSRLWSPPAAPMRRDARAADAGLPAAAPVVRAAPRPPAVRPGRLAVGFTAVAAIGIVAVTAASLAVGPDAARDLPADAAPAGSGVASLAQEGSGQGHLALPVRPDDALSPLDQVAGPASSPVADAAGTSAPDAAPDTSAPIPTAQGERVPGTTGPGSSLPDASTPGSSAPTTPPTPTAPTAPSPAPPPSSPAPPPAAPRALAFTGITAHHAVNLLGIRVLSGYTLALTGEPGATASVTYAGMRAGSVTFDEAGAARITLGGSLLNLGLTDPLVRAAYSDGTAGAAVEARRSAI